MCHLPTTIFLILAIISSDDISGTFCVVIGLVLSFVMHRSYLFSSFVIGPWLELRAETRKNTMHSKMPILISFLHS
jgi:hypothetical protein